MISMSSNANENIKIARFIDMDACKEVFSEDYSTFLLCSHKCYEDKEELRVYDRKGSTLETDFVLLSCWTILDGDEPTEEEWEIFEKDLPEKSPVVAIISSPQKVYNLLYKTLNIKRKNGRSHPFFDIKHDRVKYYPDKKKPKGKLTILDAIFSKDKKKFEKEKEYRFGVHFSAAFHEIITYIFNVPNPCNYIDKYYFNPNNKLKAEELSKLFCILQMSGDFYKRPLWNLLANKDVLLNQINVKSIKKEKRVKFCNDT